MKLMGSGMLAELGDSGGLGSPFDAGGDGCRTTTGTIGGDCVAATLKAFWASFSQESKPSCVGVVAVDNGGDDAPGDRRVIETLRECDCRLD